jgi:alpha-glucosidase
VATEREDPASLLSLYRRLIELRRSEAALSVGDIAPLPTKNDLMAYVRKTEERRLLIVLNLGAHARTFDMADLRSRGRLLLSTHLDRGPKVSANALRLRADEGVIIELL